MLATEQISTSQVYKSTMWLQKNRACLPLWFHVSRLASLPNDTSNQSENLLRDNQHNLWSLRSGLGPGAIGRPLRTAMTPWSPWEVAWRGFPGRPKPEKSHQVGLIVSLFKGTKNSLTLLV